MTGRGKACEGVYPTNRPKVYPLKGALAGLVNLVTPP